MITVTSLTHPTMLAKIRNGLRCAALGKGHEMGGHSNRVYVANGKGHNIMRIDWKGNGKFIAYGGADWGQTDVTEIVKAALKRGNIPDYNGPTTPTGRIAISTDFPTLNLPALTKNQMLAIRAHRVVSFDRSQESFQRAARVFFPSNRNLARELDLSFMTVQAEL